MTILKLALIGAAMSLVSCSSPSKDIRSRVSKGMDKDAVLEELGNPSRSKRVDGADRWSYDQYTGDEKQVTHVYFKKGRVSFVGRDDELVKELKEMSMQKKNEPQEQEFRELK